MNPGYLRVSPHHVPHEYEELEEGLRFTIITASPETHNAEDMIQSFGTSPLFRAVADTESTPVYHATHDGIKWTVAEEEVVKRSSDGGCSRKKRYDKKKEAKRIAKRVKGQKGARPAVYRCTYCNGWHLTSRNDAAYKMQIRHSKRNAQ